jgi:hypothetical protein
MARNVEEMIHGLNAFLLFLSSVLILHCWAESQESYSLQQLTFKTLPLFAEC